MEEYLKQPLPKGDNSLSIETLQEYLDDPDKFLSSYNVLWIWGTGTSAGHTTLAVLLATELLKKGHTVKFIDMQRLLDAFTEFDKKTEYFDSIKDFDVYLLDDIFTPKRNFVRGEYTLAHLYSWLKKLLVDDKHFICTSKVALPDVDIVYDQSKDLLRKYSISLEFRGSLLKSIER
jgi:hypothetical protein